MRQIVAVLLVLAFCLAATMPAFAINQYDTINMTCSQVQAAVQRDGRAQLRYPSPGNRSQTLYDAYVADSSYCNARATKATYVPTRDIVKCKVRQCKRHAGR